jgi:hypothetical protein
VTEPQLSSLHTRLLWAAWFAHMSAWASRFLGQKGGVTTWCLVERKLKTLCTTMRHPASQHIRPPAPAKHVQTGVWGGNLSGGAGIAATDLPVSMQKVDTWKVLSSEWNVSLDKASHSLHLTQSSHDQKITTWSKDHNADPTSKS